MFSHNPTDYIACYPIYPRNRPCKHVHDYLKSEIMLAKTTAY